MSRTKKADIHLSLDEKMNRKALIFLKVLAKKIEAGKIQVETFGQWPIGEGKFGLSAYWRTKEDGEQNSGTDTEGKAGSTKS